MLAPKSLMAGECSFRLKITLIHKGQEIVVSINAVGSHLATGDARFFLTRKIHGPISYRTKL